MFCVQGGDISGRISRLPASKLSPSPTPSFSCNPVSYLSLSGEHAQNLDLAFENPSISFSLFLGAGGWMETRTMLTSFDQKKRRGKRKKLNDDFPQWKEEGDPLRAYQTSHKKRGWRLSSRFLPRSLTHYHEQGWVGYSVEARVSPLDCGHPPLILLPPL